MFSVGAKPVTVTPMVLTRVPAKDGAVSGDFAGAAAPLGRTDGSGEFRSDKEGTVTAKPGSAPKSLESGNQPTIATSATKFSVILLLLAEPVAG
jgi:hypothetical protein